MTEHTAADVYPMLIDHLTKQWHFKCLGYRDETGQYIPTLHSEECIRTSEERTKMDAI